MLFSLLGLLVLLGLFHRPLIFRGTKYFVVRLAKEQKLDLDYTIGGSIFTTLTISNLRGKPTDPGPIERLEIGTLNLRYSIPGAIRNGLSGLLKDVDLRDVFVVVDPAKSVPREKKTADQKGAKFPALFPERLNLANINFTSRSAGGDTELKGFYFNLDPEKPGALKIQTLDIPGVRRWESVSAAATFRDRNLVLTDLALGPEIQLTRLQLDASKLDADQVSASLEGRVIGAALSVALQVSDLNESNRLDLRADVSGLSSAEVASYLGKTFPAEGTISRMSIRFSGVPTKPDGWSGNMDAQLQNLAFQQKPLGTVSLKIGMADAAATVELRDAVDERNDIALTAKVALPSQLDGFPHTTASGRLDVRVPDVAALAKTVEQTASGDLSAGLDFKVTDGQLVSDLAIDSAQLAAAGAELEKTSFKIHVEKNVAANATPVFADVVSRIRGSVATIRYGDYTADSFALALASQGAAVTLEKLSLAKASNSLALEGHYTLPDDLKSWASMPVNATVDLVAPDLSAFVVPGGESPLAGELTIRGSGGAVGQKADGAFTIAGRGVRFRGVTVRDIASDVTVSNGAAHVPSFGVYLDEKNYVMLGAEVGLEAPQKYSAWVEAKLDDLSVFAPLLATPDKPATALGGSLTLSWKGNGEIQPAQHSGQGTVDLARAQFGERENLSAHLVTSYSPDRIDVPELRAVAPEGDFQASAQWADRRLAVQKIALRHAGREVLGGSIELPLDLAESKNLERLIPDDAPVKVALASRDLDIAWLMGEIEKLKAPPPDAKTAQLKKPAAPVVTGTLNTTVEAEGTLRQLAATVSVRGTKLQSSAAEKFAPADVALDLKLRDDRLKLSGTVTQRQIQPLTLSGDLPLNIEALKKSKALDPQTPIALRINLPRSPLGFVASVVPALRFIDGTAAIDLQAGGTIAKPVLSGSIQATVPNLRMRDTSLPPINALTARIDFQGDQISIRELRSGLGGGTFSVSGGINVAKLTEPTFDIRVTTREALVKQNDNLTARVTSDLRIAGPMNAGTVSGNVFVTRSRFLKDIDILPIGLPGRPAPQPPAEPAPVSFPDPPLRDWKFDVAIKTSDPFLIQGNLANGRAIVDIKLAGTGLKPWLDGGVRIEQLMTSLPFSRLEITEGNVYFTAAQPFVPQLDIRGQTVIRDYTVNVFITGQANDPQALFTSDPPLPQAEIVSLIATGATTQELTSDPNALAGRAGLLVAQKLFRKIFRKNEPSQPKETPFKNVQVDLGAPDPHSGQQSIQLRMPVGERVVLTGGVDVGGNFRGMIRYLVKFK